jgi:hypothetical protein
VHARDVLKALPRIAEAIDFRWFSRVNHWRVSRTCHGAFLENLGVAASSKVLRIGRTERSLKQSLQSDLQVQPANCGAGHVGNERFDAFSKCAPCEDAVTGRLGHLTGNAASVAGRRRIFFCGAIP